MVFIYLFLLLHLLESNIGQSKILIIVVIFYTKFSTN